MWQESVAGPDEGGGKWWPSPCGPVDRGGGAARAWVRTPLAHPAQHVILPPPLLVPALPGGLGRRPMLPPPS